jgi:hypothetical protein
MGIAAAVVASIGLDVPLLIVAVIVGVGAAVVAVRLASQTAGYVVLAVAVVGPALATDRPPAWQLVLLAAAVAGFLLTPDADQPARASLLAAGTGVVLSGAVAVVAQHSGRGLGPYLVGLVILALALFLVLRPALMQGQRDNGPSGQTMDG